MIIDRLRLRNYRRFREADLELGSGTITILGRNGAGKSTILEAIGFALFGVPATRTGKDLIRSEAAPPGDAVEVRLDLRVGGQAVIVRRSLKGKNLTPDASLEVDGAVQVATGPSSSTAVTDAVERLLGMDREAFFTTVVARQKELGRLADQTPAERKRFILGMLGIDRLDRAITEARRLGRDARVRSETLAADMPDEKALAAAKQAADSELDAARKSAAAATAAAAQAEEQRERAAAAVDAIQRLQEEHREKEGRVRTVQATIEAATKQRADLQARLEQAQKAATEAEALQPLATQAAPLRERLATGQARHALAARRDALNRRLASMGEPADVAPAIQAAEQRLGAVKEQIAAGDVEAAGLAARCDHQKERIESLSDLEHGASCPLCEQPLADAEGMVQRLETDLAGLTQKTKQWTERRRLLDIDRAKLENDLQALRTKEREQFKAQAAADELRAQLQQAEKELAALPTPEAPLEALTQQLEEAEAAARKLEAARALAAAKESLAGDVAELDARLAAAKKEEASALEDLARSRFEPRKAEEARKALALAQQTERDALRSAGQASTRQGVAEQRLAAAAADLAGLAERKVRLREARHEARLWNEVAQGHGRGLLERFRAHLVARVAPAVSAEASRLLSAFTGGRYTEVLLDQDYALYVTDGGTPYTLDRFSGGEADLVHLALRLAVSRLIIDRSGGPELRFLALDEVFGSLDDERRGHVLAALHGLGALYSQILVVTHQDALRDALDAAIVVEDEAGMAVAAMHNG